MLLDELLEELLDTDDAELTELTDDAELDDLLELLDSELDELEWLLDDWLDSPLDSELTDDAELDDTLLELTELELLKSSIAYTWRRPSAALGPGNCKSPVWNPRVDGEETSPVSRVSINFASHS